MRSPSFLIGFAAGWFTARLVASQRTGMAQEDLQWALDNCRSTLADRTAEVGRLRAALESARAELPASKAAPAAEAPVPMPTRAPEDSKPLAAADTDDLKIIEGIGGKIAGLLAEHGINTFASLAATDAAHLREILHEGGPRFRMANPESWPLQAELAARGAWDELTALQSRLKAGNESPGSGGA